MPHCTTFHRKSKLLYTQKGNARRISPGVKQENYFTSLKDSTIAHYKGHIENNIKPYIGGTKLSALTPHMIQALYNRLLRTPTNPKGVSAKTIKNLHGVIHKSLKLAVRLGYIKNNPSDACELPRIEKKKLTYLEENDIKALLNAISGHKFENLYIVDLFTGMRQGEILGLTWEHVDFEAGTLTIAQQLQKERKKGGKHHLVSNKNDRIRKIKPAHFVMDILKKQQRKQMEDQLRAGNMWNNELHLVFTDELGGHLYAITVYKNFKKIAASIGIPDARFHDMRHTFAMLSLQNGDDIKTVQQNIGHSTAALTLDVYAYVSLRMQEESANRMQSYFDGLKATS